MSGHQEKIISVAEHCSFCFTLQSSGHRLLYPTGVNAANLKPHWHRTAGVSAQLEPRWPLIMTMKLPKLSIYILCAGLFSGCATWAQHGVIAEDNNKFRIAVLPIEITAEIGEISDITTLPPETTSPETTSPPEIVDKNALIQAQMKVVGEQLTRDLNARLSESKYIEIIPIESSEGVASILTSTAPRAWSNEEFDQFKIGRDVQAVLLVRLVGYGKLKKKWLTYLIGIGVGEAVVQGVLAAKLVGNPSVGIAFAVVEIGQEILVWGGGSYLFNKLYAPVTLEVQLISTLDGKPIWDETVFVSVDKKAIEALPEEDQKKKEIQLNLTAKKALNELSSNLDKAAKSNLNVKSNLLNEPIDSA